jgi:hypothetical protein
LIGAQPIVFGTLSRAIADVEMAAGLAGEAIGVLRALVAVAILLPVSTGLTAALGLPLVGLARGVVTLVATMTLVVLARGWLAAFVGALAVTFTHGIVSIPIASEPTTERSGSRSICTACMPMRRKRGGAPNRSTLRLAGKSIQRKANLLLQLYFISHLQHRRLQPRGLPRASGGARLAR